MNASFLASFTTVHLVWELLSCCSCTVVCLLFTFLRSSVFCGLVCSLFAEKLLVQCEYRYKKTYFDCSSIIIFVVGFYYFFIYSVINNNPTISEFFHSFYCLFVFDWVRTSRMVWDGFFTWDWEFFGFILLDTIAVCWKIFLIREHFSKVFNHSKSSVLRVYYEYFLQIRRDDSEFVCTVWFI